MGPNLAMLRELYLDILYPNEDWLWSTLLQSSSLVKLGFSIDAIDESAYHCQLARAFGSTVKQLRLYFCAFTSTNALQFLQHCTALEALEIAVDVQHIPPEELVCPDLFRFAVCNDLVKLNLSWWTADYNVVRSACQSTLAALRCQQFAKPGFFVIQLGSTLLEQVQQGRDARGFAGFGPGM